MVNFNSPAAAAAATAELESIQMETSFLKSQHVDHHRTPSPLFNGFGASGMKVGSRERTVGDRITPTSTSGSGFKQTSFMPHSSPPMPNSAASARAPNVNHSPKSVVVKASACVEAASRVSSTMSSEMDRRTDLADRLNEAQQFYTYQQMGWPSSYSVLSMSDLPHAVMQRYEARKGVCLCGVFPEIKRVWTSVDTSLFLWRYDVSDDTPVEYTGEDQAICSVGLVKPHIFMQTVQYVLVVATSIEIALVGLCGNGSLTDPLKTIAFLPLPMYSVPSDGVMTICMTTSQRGRIFLGGQDGHIYELLYSAAESWITKRCSNNYICSTFRKAIWYGQ